MKTPCIQPSHEQYDECKKSTLPPPFPINPCLTVIPPAPAWGEPGDIEWYNLQYEARAAVVSYQTAMAQWERAEYFFHEYYAAVGGGKIEV